MGLVLVSAQPQRGQDEQLALNGTGHWLNPLGQGEMGIGGTGMRAGEKLPGG